MPVKSAHFGSLIPIPARKASRTARRQGGGGVVRGGVGAGLYPADGPAAAQLVEDYEDTLFSRLLSFEQHVLHGLLLYE